MTLVNLQLTALALPGAENPSKNHGDGHRLLNFALTLQETLKGRDSLSLWLGSTSSGQTEVSRSRHLSDFLARPLANSHGPRGNHTPCSHGAWLTFLCNPLLCLRASAVGAKLSAVWSVSLLDREN